MKPEVFIIESLHQEDHEEGRLEGKLIHQLLRMGGRKPEYRCVESRDQFDAAVQQFDCSQYRYLHISCHGCKTAFGFYFGGMPFSEFARITRSTLRNRRVFISACEAVNQDLADYLIPGSGCYSVIGPYQSIPFDDAAILWASYYYLAFKDDQVRMDRRLILRSLRDLTRLYRVNLNYYSTSRSKGVKLTQLVGAKTRLGR